MASSSGGKKGKKGGGKGGFSESSRSSGDEPDEAGCCLWVLLGIVAAVVFGGLVTFFVWFFVWKKDENKSTFQDRVFDCKDKPKQDKPKQTDTKDPGKECPGKSDEDSGDEKDCYLKNLPEWPGHRDEEGYCLDNEGQRIRRFYKGMRSEIDDGCGGKYVYTPYGCLAKSGGEESFPPVMRHIITYNAHSGQTGQTFVLPKGPPNIYVFAPHEKGFDVPYTLASIGHVSTSYEEEIYYNSGCMDFGHGWKIYGPGDTAPNLSISPLFEEGAVDKNKAQSVATCTFMRDHFAPYIADRVRECLADPNSPDAKMCPHAAPRSKQGENFPPVLWPYSEHHPQNNGPPQIKLKICDRLTLKYMVENLIKVLENAEAQAKNPDKKYDNVRDYAKAQPQSTEKMHFIVPMGCNSPTTGECKGTPDDRPGCLHKCDLTRKENCIKSLTPHFPLIQRREQAHHFENEQPPHFDMNYAWSEYFKAHNR